MSRIGKKIITIPEKTEVTVSNGVVSVKGPKGTLTRDFRANVDVKVENGIVTVSPSKKAEHAVLWGTCAAHLQNMIKGVTESFQKKLILEGIGYKSEVKGNDLVLQLGFSHPVKVGIPSDLKVTAEKNIMTISGNDTERVGQFTARIRDLKKPEPYKGKGIRYDNEVVKRKEGKKAA